MATDDIPDLEVQEAINRALAAEREASSAVARSEAEAEALLARSRERAQQIRQRGAQRAAALHERYGQLREKRITRELARATAENPRTDPDEEKTRIEEAVSRVAARLTGVES